MGSERNLTIWIEATRDQTSEAYTLLSNHWFSGKSKLPATWLTSLTGPTSSIANMITIINNDLVSEEVVTDVDLITEDYMAAY